MGKLVGVAAALLLHASAALAQFDKQEWPATAVLPELMATDQYGKQWDWNALKGHAVLINFWATWCGPCKEELPSLQSLAGRAGGEAPVVLAVNVKEAPERVLQFARMQGLKLPVLMDPKGDLTRQFGVRIYPTTILISASGKPRWRVLGSLDWSGNEAGGWISELQDVRH